GEVGLEVGRGDGQGAEGADGATVADVDPLGRGDPAARAGAARRAVDLPALRAALPAQTALADLAQELGLRAGRGVLVLEVGRRDDALHGVRVAHPRSSGSKHLMSAISPRVSAAQRGRTRRPVRTRDSLGASSAWRIAVSAPSRRISAQAKGRASGCFARGAATHDQVVTTPPGPTGTKPGSVAAPVSGSCSCGGQSTRPVAVRLPTRRRARSSAKKRPSTRPTERRGASATPGRGAGAGGGGHPPPG